MQYTVFRLNIALSHLEKLWLISDYLIFNSLAFVVDPDLTLLEDNQSTVDRNKGRESWQLDVASSWMHC